MPEQALRSGLAIATVAALLGVFTEGRAEPALPLTRAAATAAQDRLAPLPERPSQRPNVYPVVPHLQLHLRLRPTLHYGLFALAFALPDVENRPTGVVGARGFGLPDELRRRNVVADRPAGGRGGGRGGAGGFGHIHDDGSVHVTLPLERAREVVNARWGARHPVRDDYVLLFTPQSDEELAVTFQLIVEGYNHATGRLIDAADHHDLPSLPPAPPPPATVFVDEGGYVYHTLHCAALQGRTVREAELFDLGPAAQPCTVCQRR